MAAFKWTPRREKAALALAEGYTVREAVERSGAGDRTIWRWYANPEFRAEVDRLSLMIGISSRAERLRIAMKVARQRVRDDHVTTEKDILEWLKFAQSETDGAKLDLAALFSAMEAATGGDAAPGGGAPSSAVP